MRAGVASPLVFRGLIYIGKTLDAENINRPLVQINSTHCWRRVVIDRIRFAAAYALGIGATANEEPFGSIRLAERNALGRGETQIARGPADDQLSLLRLTQP